MKKSPRLWVQIGFAALTNGYVLGFTNGRIYQGSTKALCVPGLNCYSCPGALASCPIGSLQAVLGSRDFSFSFYVIGFLMIVGAFFGRFVCGWLCPFGLVQDLLHKIPLPRILHLRKRNNLPGHRYLKFLKYVILVVFVLIMPMFVLDIIGQGSPWFCKLICPAGTLEAGIILPLLNPSLQSAIGWLYTWKIMLLVVILVLSIFVYRPFCKYLCPLGAIYGCFNPIALYRFRIDESSCIGCHACQRACPMEIPVYESPNNAECIRCGKCRKACPTGCIHTTLEKKRQTEEAAK
ncbi:4Fe-4S binding protein [Hespellia stercorisuis]|uniref:4Fe-4S binding domain-containing protein n=1 Tax=Hespellia stercorisuis DSM 15480 TaxID=1121950 RepID=A0A1M6U7T3_9FIRM|nr:4Fe-4S binding protein [Hespellia stercorisuis]SHK65335.1 4Fe-4S binding domain-containing protein [Hespellia stercorisuis DSM 15480]